MKIFELFEPTIETSNKDVDMTHVILNTSIPKFSHHNDEWYFDGVEITDCSDFEKMNFYRMVGETYCKFKFTSGYDTKTHKPYVQLTVVDDFDDVYRFIMTSKATSVLELLSWI